MAKRAKNKPNIRILPARKPKKPYDRERANHGVLRRTTFIMIFCGVLLFIPLIGQLFKLMILEHDKYESQAITNQTRSTSVSASRGMIYDRNMNALAASTTVENVFIDPLEIDRAEHDENRTNEKQTAAFIADGLGKILDVDPGRILELASDVKMRYKIVARKQPREVAEQVRAFINENNLTGIHLENDAQRYYPFGTMAAQVIGFTNAEGRGSEGLEAYYDDTLEGTAGAVITTKGNYETQMLYSYEKYYEATNGNSLVLTIDSTVQFYLEKNLKAAIEKYDVQHDNTGVSRNTTFTVSNTSGTKTSTALNKSSSKLCRKITGKSWNSAPKGAPRRAECQSQPVSRIFVTSTYVSKSSHPI